jgi:hypothetical protein
MALADLREVGRRRKGQNDMNPRVPCTTWFTATCVRQGVGPDRYSPHELQDLGSLSRVVHNLIPALRKDGVREETRHAGMIARKARSLPDDVTFEFYTTSIESAALKH